MIYLDSADDGDAVTAADLGLIAGITTNPTLMIATGRAPLEQLRRLLERFPSGPIYYQVQAADLETGLAEAEQARALDPERVVLKLPAVREHYRLAARLTARGARCAMTAVYTPAQALLARQVGAGAVIAYGDRALRLQDGGAQLISSLAAALPGRDGAPRRPRIIAASLKSPDQVVRTVTDGADAVTLPLAVIEAMIRDPLTEQAVAEFAAAAR